MSPASAPRTGGPGSDPPPARPSPTRVVLLSGALVVGAVAALAWVRHRLPLAEILGWRAVAVAGGLCASLVLTAWTLARELRAPRGGGGPAALRWALHLGFWTCVVQVAWLDPFRTILFQSLAGIASGLFAAGLLVADRTRGHLPRRALTRLEVVSSVLVLAALGGELGLRALARLRPSPLLLSAESGPAQELAANRFPPGGRALGSTLNSRGYLDTELDPDLPGTRPLAVVIGDSFGFCQVPWVDHYTSVCERVLGRGELYNMGVPAVGPEEYLALLQQEALALEPDVVVVALFVGNDIPDRPPERAGWRSAGLRGLLDRRSLRSLELVRRVLARARERRRARGEPRAADTAEAGSLAEGPLEERHRWLADPLLEPPTFSEQTFLEIELRRARQIARADAADPVETLVPILERIVAAAGRVPVLFLLIPDELQVEDPLWEELAAELAGQALERDRPQRLLCEAFERRGWRYVDLLPALRAVAPLPDGRRHLYHLRDTHFNRRGCQVAGSALAAGLEPLWRAAER